jgi:hypothetical protein
MSLYSEIIELFPELTITPEKDNFFDGTIVLGDDGDGVNYIKEWNYSKPLPKSLEKYLRHDSDEL